MKTTKSLHKKFSSNIQLPEVEHDNIQLRNGKNLPFILLQRYKRRCSFAHRPNYYTLFDQKPDPLEPYWPRRRGSSPMFWGSGRRFRGWGDDFFRPPPPPATRKKNQPKSRSQSFKRPNFLQLAKMREALVSKMCLYNGERCWPPNDVEAVERAVAVKKWWAPF